MFLGIVNKDIYHVITAISSVSNDLGCWPVIMVFSGAQMEIQELTQQLFSILISALNYHVLPMCDQSL